MKKLAVLLLTVGAAHGAVINYAFTDTSGTHNGNAFTFLGSTGTTSTLPAYVVSHATIGSIAVTSDANNILDIFEFDIASVINGRTGITRVALSISNFAGGFFTFNSDGMQIQPIPLLAGGATGSGFSNGTPLAFTLDLHDTPEPSTFAFIGLGLAAIAALRFLRRQTDCGRDRYTASTPESSLHR